MNKKLLVLLIIFCIFTWNCEDTDGGNGEECSLESGITETKEVSFPETPGENEVAVSAVIDDAEDPQALTADIVFPSDMQEMSFGFKTSMPVAIEFKDLVFDTRGADNVVDKPDDSLLLTMSNGQFVFEPDTAMFSPVCGPCVLELMAISPVRFRLNNCKIGREENKPMHVISLKVSLNIGPPPDGGGGMMPPPAMCMTTGTNFSATADLGDTFPAAGMATIVLDNGTAGEVAIENLMNLFDVNTSFMTAGGMPAPPITFSELNTRMPNTTMVMIDGTQIMHAAGFTTQCRPCEVIYDGANRQFRIDNCFLGENAGNIQHVFSARITIN